MVEKYFVMVWWEKKKKGGGGIPLKIQSLSLSFILLLSFYLSLRFFARRFFLFYHDCRAYCPNGSILS